METETRRDIQTSDARRVALRPHPFSTLRQAALVKEGSSIQDILEELNVREDALVEINGKVVSPLWYAHVRPKQGTQIDISLRPHGGGGGNKNALMIILQIVVVIVALITFQWYALSGTAFTVGGAAVTWGQIAAAAVLTVGNLAIAALFPPPSPDQFSDTRAVFTGVSNTYSPYGVIPCPMGKRRMFPPMAAKPYTETQDGNTYLRTMFLYGYGPVAVEDRRIGETPIEEYDDVEYNEFLGHPNDPEPSIYTQDIYQDFIQAKIPHPPDTVTDGEWVVRRTQPETKEIGIDLTFPTGVMKTQDDGDRKHIELIFRVQYRQKDLTDEGDWQDFSNVGVGYPDRDKLGDAADRWPRFERFGAATVPGRWRIHAKAGGLYAVSLHWKAPGQPDQYDIRIKLTTETFMGGQEDDFLESPKLSNLATWTAIRSILPNRKPLTQPGMAYIEMRIKATDQLQGNLESYNAIVTREALTYTPLHANEVENPDFEVNADGYTLSALTTLTRRTTSPISGSASGELERTAGGGLHYMSASEFLTDRLSQAGTEYYCKATFKSDATSDGMVAQIGLRFTGQSPPIFTAIKEVTLVNGQEQTLILDGRADGAVCPVESEGHDLVQLLVLVRNADNVTPLPAGTKCKIDDILLRPIWTVQECRNPSALMRFVLQRTANARPVGDDRLVLEDFEQYSRFCDKLGLTYDKVVSNSNSVFGVLQNIGGVARGSMTIRDSKYAPIWDDFKTDVVQYFSVANIHGFSGHKRFLDRPDAFRVIYNDEEVDYEESEVMVYDKGKNKNNSTSFEELPLDGVVNSGQAQLIGQYFYNIAKLRPEAYNFRTDIENLRCTRGDLIEVQHPTPLWGVSAARIRAVSTSAGSIQEITVDAPLVMEAGKIYAIKIRHDDMTMHEGRVVTIAGEQTVLTPSETISDASLNVGDLLIFGEAGLVTKRLLIKEIAPKSDLSAVLHCQDYSPEALKNNKPPNFNPGITPQPEPQYAIPPKPRIIGLSSDETVMEIGPGGRFIPRIKVNVRIGAGKKTNQIPASSYEVQYQSHGSDFEDGPTNNVTQWVSAGKFPVNEREIFISNVDEGDLYTIRVRSISDVTGRTSDWRGAEHRVVGQSQPPGDITVMTLEERHLIISGYNRPVDFSHYVLRISSGAEVNWESSVIFNTYTEDIIPLSLVPPGDFVALVKAVDLSGNESENPASVVVSLGNRIPDAKHISLLLTDKKADIWPGSKFQCSIDGSNNLVADVATTFWIDSRSKYYNTDGGLFWTTKYKTMQYTGTISLLNDPSPIYVYWKTNTDNRLQTWQYKRSTDPASSYARWQDGAEIYDGLTYNFRITFVGGRIRPECNEFTLDQRANMIEDVVSDLVTSPLSTRLPLTKIFTEIKAISFTVQSDGNGGVGVVVLDKNPTLGPDVIVVDSSGTAVTGLIDAVIQGV